MSLKYLSFLLVLFLPNWGGNGHAEFTTVPAAVTTSLVVESFETDGHAAGRYVQAPYVSAAVQGFDDSDSDWFLRTNVAGVSSRLFSDFSAMDGSFFLGGEDVDDAQNPDACACGRVNFNNLNVTGFTSITVKLLAAATQTERYEPISGTQTTLADYLRVEVSVDGGAYTTIGQFTGVMTNSVIRLDTDLNGIGDGTELTAAFQDFSFDLNLSGNSSVDVRVEMHPSGSGEEMAIDNIRIDGEGAATSPEINLKQASTSIADGGSFDFGTVQIGDAKDVIFTIENTGDGDLDLTTPLSVSGAGFSLQSQPANDPVSAASSTSFTVRFAPTATSQTSGSIAIVSDDADETTYNISFSATVTDATLSIKVFLEGPLSGSTMSTNLNASLPTAQPYANAIAETSVGIPGTAVDWVEVELRTGTASGTKVGTNRAGILKSDGTIVDKDGAAFTMPQADGSDYYLVIHHRNHLSVMSSAAVSPSSGSYTFDFTTAQANSYSNGSDGAVQVGSVFAMFSGDSDDDGDVDGTDLTTWRAQNGKTYTYSSNGKTDLNLDGTINAIDRNDFQQKNSTKSSQVPTT